MEILEKTVGPSDCLLAVALPLTREEFLDDLRPESSKDYAKFYRSNLWGRPSEEAAWASYREHLSNLIEGVVAEVECLGVKVVRGVSLADLPSLLAYRPVVTLVSHWRGGEVEPHDFIDFPGFLDRLSRSPDEVVARIRSGLSEGVAAGLRGPAQAGGDPSFRQALILELNDLLANGNLGARPGFGDAEGEQPLHPEQRTFLNRKTLDAAFEGVLHGGNRMEFFDGLQTAEAIRESVPEDFAGLLDLIVCNSVLSAEVIKAMKRNCLILSNQFPARPDLRLLLYKATIRALSLQPGSFVKTMMTVRQGLGNYLKNYA